jgi:hypothetical protein
MTADASSFKGTALAIRPVLAAPPPAEICQGLSSADVACCWPFRFDHFRGIPRVVQRPQRLQANSISNAPRSTGTFPQRLTTLVFHDSSVRGFELGVHATGSTR